MHRHIRNFLNPFEGVTQILKVGESIFAGNDALDLLAKQFEAQSSLSGPCDAEQLIQSTACAGLSLPHFSGSAENQDEDPHDAEWAPSEGGSSWSSGEQSSGEGSDTDQCDEVAESDSPQGADPVPSGSLTSYGPQNEFDDDVLLSEEVEIKAISEKCQNEQPTSDVHFFSFNELVARSIH